MNAIITQNFENLVLATHFFETSKQQIVAIKALEQARIQSSHLAATAAIINKSKNSTPRRWHFEK